MSNGRITVQQIRERKGAEPRICAVTAYDFTFARLADRAGVDILLVGDSLANVMLGLESTVPVTLEQTIEHCAAVVRAQPNALVVADIPFGYVQESPRMAVRHCVRVFKESGVDAVKIEGAGKLFPALAAVIDAGIPVMGHVGLMPQYRSMLGGLKVQGKELEAARRVLEDAVTVARAGCFALVLEAVPRQLAKLITGRIEPPTIGIGAGPDCDGQVLVLHDILGLVDRGPKFARRYADLSAQVTGALGAYREEVRSGAFPADEHSFHMDQSVLEQL